MERREERHTLGRMSEGPRWPSGLEHRTGDRVVLAGFESRCGNLIRFGNLATSFVPLCQCLSEETLKAVGPFYLVSMPGEVKDPTSPHWKCVSCRGGLHHPLLEKDNSKDNPV